MREPGEMGIYIHVPFCIKKCQYCDFLSFPVTGGCMGEESRERYVQALCREIRSGRLPVDQRADKIEVPQVASIFFGGGTPSLLTGEQIRRILDSVRATYMVAQDAEITMEANPGTINRESLMAYRVVGVNRLSIGLQSAQNRELKLLGRIHPGAIVLLHSTSQTNAEILDELLTKWKEMGYSFAALTELP